MEKWEEVVLAARSASNIASGSALGAPTQRKKILLAMEKWTHAKNNKKTIQNIKFSEKRKKQRTPRRVRIEGVRRGGLGGRPERKKKLLAMEKWTHTKNHRFF